ncbi:MAG: hypothetical protein AABX11_06300 [Nanoarchaeota archaeon]
MKKAIQTIHQATRHLATAMFKNRFRNGLLLGTLIGAVGLSALQRHNEYSNRPEVVAKNNTYTEQIKVFNQLDNLMRQGDDWYEKSLSRAVGNSRIESIECLNKAEELYLSASKISGTNQFVDQYQKREIESGLNAFKTLRAKFYSN